MAVRTPPSFLVTRIDLASSGLGAHRGRASQSLSELRDEPIQSYTVFKVCMPELDRCHDSTTIDYKNGEKNGIRCSRLLNHACLCMCMHVSVYDAHCIVPFFVLQEVPHAHGDAEGTGQDQIRGVSSAVLC